jgi:hypothetical protein
MAIIADIVHHGAVYRDIYISPHSINSDSFYTLKYLVGGKGGPPLLGIEMTMRSMTFNNSRAGLSKPDGAGIAYDRNVGAWPQVYADLKAKIAAGACPWITNVRDEVAEPAPVVDEPAPEPTPEAHPFADLIDATKDNEAERLRLRGRYLFLHHMLVDKSGGIPDLSDPERAELNSLQTRNKASENWLDINV